tara:strand:+ start:85 stop:369 length:285 start_codon:yes stop_codon:yes gene_type:complete
MSPIEQKIAALEEKVARERARLSDAKARATQEARKRETRRKILYGAAYLSGLKTLSDRQREQSLERIHAHILKEKDRKFLGLSVDLEVPKSATL